MAGYRLCQRIATMLTILASCWLVACGKGSHDQTAVRIGSHEVTKRAVEHWMSVLVGFGSNGLEPGPEVPVPPEYTACIVDQREHPRQSFHQTNPTREQLKADCEFEYRRFKLKTLYLLISYQWVMGEARELGVSISQAELARGLATFKKSVAPNEKAFQRYLHFTRATLADIKLSVELNALTMKVEDRIGGPVAGGGTPAQREQALIRFGKAYERKWLERTDCRPGYVVPICRQYKRPKKAPVLVPPSVPLTHMPAGG